MTPTSVIQKTATSTVPLVGGVSVSVRSMPGGGWVTSFLAGDRVLVSEESRAPPWLDGRAAGRLTTILKDALDRERMPLERKAIRESIGDWLEALGEASNEERIVSAAVARVLSATKTVTIERSQPPVYVVSVGENELVFSNAEMAADGPKKLNEKWLGAFFEVLGATTGDWKEIREFWLSVAEHIDPWGDASAFDAVVSALQVRVSSESIFVEPEGLIRSGLYLEDGDHPILWVRNSLIGEVIRDAGPDVTLSGFSLHLRKAGHLIHPSTVKRVKGVLIRAWGLAPSFRGGDDLPPTQVNTVGGDA